MSEAIRKIVWTVGEDGKTVTPAAVQDGGVQGDDNATEVVFDLTAAPLLDATMVYYVECIDSMGGYDKTEPLPPVDGRLVAPVPLAWTQHGGVITLRLVCQREGQTVYTLEGRLRFAGRPTATRRVDSLLKTEIQQTLDEMKATGEELVGEAAKGAGDAKAAAELAATYAGQAAQSSAAAGADAVSAEGAANQSAIYAGQAAASADEAAEAAETATAAEERIKTLAVPDDSTVRRDGLWSSQNIVDRLCPPFEKSGGAVTVYPVEGYPLAVQTAEPLNLIPQPYETTKSYGNPLTRGGLTFTDNGDGSITVNGTAESDVYFQLMYYGQLSGVEVGDVLRLGGCPSGGNGAYRIYAYLQNGGTDAGDGAEFAVEEWMLTGPALDIDILVSAGTVCDNLVFWPRLTKAADTPTTVTRCGKNLLPYPYNTPTQTKAGITFAANEDGSVTISGTFEEGVTGGTDATVCRTPVKHLIGETIAIPIFYTNGIRMFVHMRYVDGTTKFNWLSSRLASTRTNTDIIPENADFIMVGLAVETPYTGETTTVYPQLELGNTPTDFEPYREPETFPVAPDGTATVPAAAGCNTLWADAGDVTVTGRLDPIRILQGLMGGGGT